MLSAAAMPGTQKIHVNLPEDVHQRLRVRVAIDNTTIQAYVQKLVSQAVQNTPIPEKTP